MALDIENGTAVIWEAKYESAQPFTGYRALITVTGAGGFELADGAYLALNSYQGQAINATDPDTNVRVNGGVIEVTGRYDVAIKSVGTVVVDSGSLVATGQDGVAIDLRGGTATLNDGLLQSTGLNGRAISILSAGQQVKINGGTVEVTGEYGYAILCENSICKIVVNDGLIKATENGGKAIWSYGSGVEIGGGTISSSKGRTLQVGGATPVTMRGGVVETQGVGQAAISTSGDAPIKIQGGVVRALQANAINAYAGTVEVSGDTIIFAHMAATVGVDGVIRAKDFAGVSGNAAIIGWHWPTRKKYPVLETEGIVVAPASSVEAYWDWNASGASGIRFQNGDFSGFIEVNEVTVHKINLTRDDFSYDIPAHNIDNGKPQGIGDVIPPERFNVLTGGGIEIYYEGIDGTSYAKSSVAPANVGTYRVTVDILGGTLYGVVSNLFLGDYMINASEGAASSSSTASSSTASSSTASSSTASSSTASSSTTSSGGVVSSSSAASGNSVAGSSSRNSSAQVNDTSKSDVSIEMVSNGLESGIEEDESNNENRTAESEAGISESEPEREQEENDSNRWVLILISVLVVFALLVFAFIKWRGNKNKKNKFKSSLH